ncbi:unnamed protein product [Brachionus calyciflorus]|uniref:Uncharacterized protein n=1 Tax=Brachionus calyciflorus TaxID=104777 RepID=A0A814PUH0_9BILA|nr:unnamed protein product [Brachionus calyciflorus]
MLKILLLIFLIIEFNQCENDLELCTTNLITNCENILIEDGKKICNCVDNSSCPCLITLIETIPIKTTTKSSYVNFNKKYSMIDGEPFPLHLVYSSVIIFILILMVFFGMICSCFCSPQRRFCCIKVSNRENSNSNSNETTSTSNEQTISVYTVENSPPPKYSSEMLELTEKSEKLPDYESLFSAKNNQSV